MYIIQRDCMRRNRKNDIFMAEYRHRPNTRACTGIGFFLCGAPVPERVVAASLHILYHRKAPPRKGRRCGKCRSYFDIFTLRLTLVWLSFLSVTVRVVLPAREGVTVIVSVSSSTVKATLAAVLEAFTDTAAGSAA